MNIFDVIKIKNPFRKICYKKEKKSYKSGKNICNHVYMSKMTSIMNEPSNQ